MTGAGLSPHNWRSLTRADRVDLMAYFEHRRLQRLGLLSEVVEKIPGEIGMLAQVLIEAMD